MFGLALLAGATVAELLAPTAQGEAPVAPPPADGPPGS